MDQHAEGRLSHRLGALGPGDERQIGRSAEGEQRPGAERRAQGGYDPFAPAVERVGTAVRQLGLRSEARPKAGADVAEQHQGRGGPSVRHRRHAIPGGRVEGTAQAQALGHGGRFDTREIHGPMRLSQRRRRV
jgi:hypothetical protein